MFAYASSHLQYLRIEQRLVCVDCEVHVFNDHQQAVEHENHEQLHAQTDETRRGEHH